MKSWLKEALEPIFLNFVFVALGFFNISRHCRSERDFIYLSTYVYMYVFVYVSVYVGKDKWETEKSNVGKENCHDAFHLKPFSDQFCKRTYMEDEGLETILKAIPGCVSFGKSL